MPASISGLAAHWLYHRIELAPLAYATIDMLDRGWITQEAALEISRVYLIAALVHYRTGKVVREILARVKELGYETD